MVLSFATVNGQSKKSIFSQDAYILCRTLSTTLRKDFPNQSKVVCGACLIATHTICLREFRFGLRRD